MKKYKAFIFDFDRTIADSEKAVLFCYNQTFAHFGHPPLDPLAFKAIVGKPAEVQLRYLTGEEDPGKIEEIKAWHKQISFKYMSDMTTFFPGVREGLEILQNAGIKTGVVSNKSFELMRVPLERDGILPFLNKIFGIEQVPAPKPDPQGLLNLINAFGLDKKDALYVGDSLIDQDTAKNGELDFAAMALGGTPREAFYREVSPIAVFGCFDELLKAVL
jgi:phosphoglycolate phosphatase